jgi:FixJ family two-component response regulator
VVTRDWAPPVIFVTGRDDVITAIDVMKWGAFSYLLKPIAAEELLQTVRDALLLDKQRRAMRLDLDRLRERFETLTSDERRIFCGVLSHRLNKQLAADLGVCERTIKALRARMLDKLQIRTVPELVRAAKMLQATERGTAVEPAAWPWFDSRAGVLQSD